MAFCTLHDALPRTLSPERALYAWEVLQGRREPLNASDELFISRIKRLYIPRNYAPQDYLDMYPKVPESYKATLGVRK